MDIIFYILVYITSVVISIPIMIYIFSLLAALMDKHGKGSIIFKVPAILFFILDILYNYYITPFFWDLPDVWDETVTNRMKRYKLKWKGWKFHFSTAICNILNKFDPGHC